MWGMNLKDLITEVALLGTAIFVAIGINLAHTSADGWYVAFAATVLLMSDPLTFVPVSLTLTELLAEATVLLLLVGTTSHLVFARPDAEHGLPSLLSDSPDSAEPSRFLVGIPALWLTMVPWVLLATGVPISWELFFRFAFGVPSPREASVLALLLLAAFLAWVGCALVLGAIGPHATTEEEDILSARRGLLFRGAAYVTAAAFVSTAVLVACAKEPLAGLSLSTDDGSVEEGPLVGYVGGSYHVLMPSGELRSVPVNGTNISSKRGGLTSGPLLELLKPK